MIFIPAIDLRRNQVVRLSEGDYNREDAYQVDPFEIASVFEKSGAERIHIIDLDAAKSGKPTQLSLICDLAQSVKADIEAGGGIRDASTIDAYLNGGVSRVVLGTKACLDHGFLSECLKAFGQKIIVGIDSKNGLVATDGWTKVTDVEVVPFSRQVVQMGGKEIIHTDIARDGMMMGPNLTSTRDLCVSVPEASVIHSGGVSSINDLSDLRNLKLDNLFGVISGKAIYEKKIDVRDAVQKLKEPA
ncbi:MAG: 1-(5-phosphoribosyl)-5-[(5-phosphoribosylamino)methylideneamino]imidazole-4-carboxamide isomerase [Candidatus Omnitrophica bacterium]|nr:1-(5-phosphoribosyl)-5-[(5-phosphoribosylamino)methylideneamino]imidazole-4-carboxamide isomerase [Candidatus Omnitrophota bacterium]